MTAENGNTWCTRRQSTTATHSLDEPQIRLNGTSRTASAASVAASRVSTVVATTIVLALLLSNSPSAGAASSSFPRLQGLVGTLRLTARCTQSLSRGDDDNSDSSSSSYPVNDISDNPLLLHLPSSATQPSISYATGALLGNSALAIVVSSVSHGLYELLRRLRQKAVKRRSNAAMMFTEKGEQVHNDVSFFDGARVICTYFLPTTPLPASMLLVHALLVEPTVNAAVVSLASGDRGVTSVILGLVIGLGWIALPFAFLWLLCVRHSPLPVATVAVRRIPNVGLRFERIGRALEWLCAEREEWVAAGRTRVAREAAQNVMARLGPTFRGFRGGRHWYFIVDAALAVLTGIFVGAAESVEIADACDAAVWGTACVAAIAVASIVLIVALRPFVVRSELYSSLCVSLLAVVAGALMLASDVEASGVVSLLASVLGLLPPIAALLWNACLREKDSDVYWNKITARASNGKRKKVTRSGSLDHSVQFSRRPTTRSSVFGVSAAYTETKKQDNKKERDDKPGGKPCGVA
ncbi:membrane-associated protein, putative [Bodo saltans]|uniref:Membrane-associated protein, putative n=1 Tax=Bodo saltans TaxID=75058 RepID=A0A0S4J4R1_BODSA|nr:membrane-associated protein, putative [Bodo saltans]|eukprot:CUG80597.1 membrane-associated protein, putative [Bodo saltans]